MPVQRCQKDGKPGYRWGQAGTCFPYNSGDDDSRKAAKQKAINQGLAIGDDPAEEMAVILLGALAAREALVDVPVEEGLADGDEAVTEASRPLPRHVVAALRRGLRLVEAGRGGSGLRPATIRAARAGVRTRRWSEDKILRASAWFARHAVDRKAGWDKPGKETPGFVAWLLWGDNGNGKGRASIDRLAEQIKRERE